MEEKLMRLRALRKQITGAVERAGRTELTADETRRFEEITAQIVELRDEMKRAGRLDADTASVARATVRVSADGRGNDWAARAANAIQRMGGESRAVTSGSIDIPNLVEPNVIAKPRPARLIDLLVNRQQIDGNAFEFYQQTVRTNNAAPVADSATKPTSTFTITPVQDRARVIAHLTEPIPLRLLADHASLRMWLDTELVEGLLDALEAQVISGSGTGENMTGILTASGSTQVAFNTDIPTTLRSALTALQVIGVQPNAWVLHPADAQAIDLTPEGTGGVGFKLDGYTNTNAGSGNIFGDSMIQRVVSPSVPQGTAILADWSKVKLYVREQARIDIDLSGAELFDKNQAKLRGEMRVGMGILMPSCFAEIDLTA